jgi:hypothetical protein
LQPASIQLASSAAAAAAAAACGGLQATQEATALQLQAQQPILSAAAEETGGSVAADAPDHTPLPTPRRQQLQYWSVS